MNILIVGGAGFVGTNFVNYWFKNHPKDSLLLIDTKQAPILEIWEEWMLGERFQFVTQDIRNGKEIKAIFDHFEPEVVLNLVDGTRDPDYLQVNVMGVNNLLEAAAAQPIEHFIHLSCGEIYGINQNRLFSENDPLLPSNPQMASQAAGDILVWSYKIRYNLPVTTLRSSYLFGPYQSPQRLISLIVTKLLKNQPVNLQEFKTRERDLLYVNDLIQALELVIGNNKAKGEIFNVGSGIRSSINEIAELIVGMMEKSKHLLTAGEVSTDLVSYGLDVTN